jgi:hypothetical protein
MLLACGYVVIIVVIIIVVIAAVENPTSLGVLSWKGSTCAPTSSTNDDYERYNFESKRCNEHRIIIGIFIQYRQW